MDELDLAQRHIEADLSNKISAQRAKAEQDLLFASNGFCLDCGNRISVQRLEVFPNAMRCFDCQFEFEEGLKR